MPILVGTGAAKGATERVEKPRPAEPRTPVNSSTDSKPPPVPLLVSVSFRPIWAYIDGVREFGRFFCETTFKRPELAARAQVVLQETLENAVKYSSPREGGKLEVEISSDGVQLQISTLSQADPIHLQTLREEIDMLRRFDPEAAYLAAFARAAHEPEASARLGLARMRYEGQFDLTVNEEADGHVRVTAVGKV